MGAEAALAAVCAFLLALVCALASRVAFLGGELGKERKKARRLRGGAWKGQAVTN